MLVKNGLTVNPFKQFGTRPTVAVAAASVMSDRYCIASQGKKQPYVSDAYLLSCCKQCGSGCQGGSSFAALGFWQSGIPTGGMYGMQDCCQPYPFNCAHCPSATTPKCSKECIPSYRQSFNSSLTYGHDAYKILGEENAQREIFENGPVVGRMVVFEDLYIYVDGNNDARNRVYEHEWGKAMNQHAVRIIGWGEEDGTPYWLVANSWGENTQDEGTFKIIRGRNECGIEGYMAAVKPKLE
ncbi:unnamed protein product [Soboliphyme baturini]|uniref:Pept_C1 domain-containing protein n=1 Tax=Soboliphyme baturini TaxID=241478 RepID=A0A183J3I2_9BILA|nr:unnamed protein product [Soboliphyme baturini]